MAVNGSEWLCTLVLGAACSLPEWIKHDYGRHGYVQSHNNPQYNQPKQYNHHLDYKWGNQPLERRYNKVLPKLHSTTFVPNIPKQCELAGYCEDVPNYPEGHVIEMIKQLGNVTGMFKMDQLLPDLVSRSVDGLSDEKELCMSKEKIIVPRAAPDVNGVWHFVVNTKDQPFQGYKVEVCHYRDVDNRACDDIAYFPAHNSECKQKFVLRHTRVLDAEKGLITDIPVWVPSCCACILTSNRHR